MRKQAQLTGSVHDKFSILNTKNDDNDDVALEPGSTRHAQQNFKINQFVLLLQQADWLKSSTRGQQSTLSAQVMDDSLFITNHVTPQILKAWSSEIKQQESRIALSRRNALNPDQQLSSTDVHESELAPSLNNTGDSIRQTELLSSNEQNVSNGDANYVIARIGSDYSLNEKQWMAYQIITNCFVQKFIAKKDTVNRLSMFMTGPGRTGKTVTTGSSRRGRAKRFSLCSYSRFNHLLVLL